MSIGLTGRKILSLVSCLLLVSVFAQAATKKKGHPAPKHEGHAGAKHASSHTSQIVHHDSSKGTKRKAHAHGRKTARRHGQQQIDGARAREIQTALIRANYMEGEPTGKWDQTTKEAMTRFQADNGWQTKTLPDSRALIKLGLGPNHDHLLNPETAMTSRSESAGGGQKETEFAAPMARPALDGGKPITPLGTSNTTHTVLPSAPAGISGTAETEQVVPATTPH